MAVKTSPNIPPFVRFCTASVPMVFDNSMSYYECLCALTKFIQDDVINVININAQQLEGLLEGFEELKAYVDNYFDNLDVQTEINNKLDEMAEGGQLASIIAQFLAVAPVFGYHTIAEMAAATNLSNGTIARVIGNTTATDGDGAYYLIRTKTGADTPDGLNLVAIGDILVGVRVKDAVYNAIEEIVSNPINVKFFGAKGDGVTDDSTVIQDLVDNNARKTIYFPAGNYLLRSGIRVNHNRPICIKMDRDARLFTDTTLTCMIDLGVDRDPDEHFHILTDPYIQHIDGGIIDCENVQFGIRNQSSSAHMYIKDTSLINVDGYGIYCDQDEYYSTSGSHITDVDIQGVSSNSANASTGIYLKGHDNKLNNISMTGTKIGVDCHSAGNYLTFVHPVASFTDNTFTAAEFNATKAFTSYYDNYFINCYADTYGTGFDIHTQAHQLIQGCFTYWWQSPTEAELYSVKFDTTDAYNANATITDCNFSMPNRSNITAISASPSYLNLQMSNNSCSSYVKETDLIYNLNFNGKTNAVPFVLPETQLTAEANYLIGYVERGAKGVVSFSISYGNTSKYNVSIPYTYNSHAFYSANVYGGGANYKLLLCDEVTFDGKTFAKLVLQTVTGGASWSAFYISNVGGNGLYIKNSKAKTPISVTDVIDQVTLQ